MPTVKSWPKAERPRERLLASGPTALSDAELLAILLRSGVRGKDAVALSRELLKRFGGLRGLFSAGLKELRGIKGLGEAKIAALLGATEIARRRLREEIVGQTILRDPEAVMHYLYGSLRDKKREVFKVIFLNKALHILDERDLFEGSVDQTVISVREVVKAALDLHATALVVVHNHPSGRVEPSPEDKEMTAKLKAACASVSIQILDHLIVGDNAYFSFNERGLI